MMNIKYKPIIFNINKYCVIDIKYFYLCNDLTRR